LPSFPGAPSLPIGPILSSQAELHFELQFDDALQVHWQTGRSWHVVVHDDEDEQVVEQLLIVLSA
jgi:hypothetical protein